jgi:hypothetical protein
VNSAFTPAAFAITSPETGCDNAFTAIGVPLEQARHHPKDSEIHQNSKLYPYAQALSPCPRVADLPQV